MSASQYYMPTAQRTIRVRSASDPTAYRHKVGEGGDYHRQIEEAAEYRRQIQLVEEYFRQLSVVEEYFNFDTVHNDVSAGEQRFSSSDSDSADLIASGLSFGQDAAGDISLHHQTGESSPFEPAQLHIHLDMGPGSGQGLFEEHGAWQTLLGDDDLTGTTLAAGDHDSDVAIGVALESTIEHADQPEFGFATPEVTTRSRDRWASPLDCPRIPPCSRWWSTTLSILVLPPPRDAIRTRWHSVARRGPITRASST